MSMDQIFHLPIYGLAYVFMTLAEMEETFGTGSFEALIIIIGFSLACVSFYRFKRKQRRIDVASMASGTSSHSGIFATSTQETDSPEVRLLIEGAKKTYALHHKFIAAVCIAFFVPVLFLNHDLLYDQETKESHWAILLFVGCVLFASFDTLFNLLPPGRIKFDMSKAYQRISLFVFFITLDVICLYLWLTGTEAGQGLVLLSIVSAYGTFKHFMRTFRYEKKPAANMDSMN